MLTKVSESIYYVGANDHEIDLFEGQYIVPNGMSYNSYVIVDEKVAVMDTIDKTKTNEWLGNLENALDGRLPDYLIVQHMEPDHSASIEAFANKYPDATVVANPKAFKMISQFFPNLKLKNTIEAENGGELDLGTHKLNFVYAPMVHWPEVMMTYESSEKILFSADGFGKFGALDVEEDWACEARRYYIGIVGKYGAQVQAVLKKASALEIEKICPLHGPVLAENLGYYINLYDIWSGYLAETNGVCICYTSVYGNTKKAVLDLAEQLRGKGVPNVVVNDLARCDMAEAVEDAFRYDKLVLATTTYNGEIFPFMKQFIDHLTERFFQKRTVGFIQNGTWGPVATKIMKGMLEKSKDLAFCENEVTILSALNEESTEQLKALAEELAESYIPVQVEEDTRIDKSAIHKIGYGLYVVTCNDGDKDNGLIVNTVSQVCNSPTKLIVNINKENYSAEVIRKNGVLNVCTLNETAPFKLFEHFGFTTGRTTDKFDREAFPYWEASTNGLPYLTRYANGYISLEVTDTVDMGTHWMFVCNITESQTLNDIQTVSYDYYLNNIKPKPIEDVKGWVCEICGYVYEDGKEPPEDFICPLCKHGMADFVYVE